MIIQHLPYIQYICMYLYIGSVGLFKFWLAIEFRATFLLFVGVLFVFNLDQACVVIADKCTVLLSDLLKFSSSFKKLFIHLDTPMLHTRVCATAWKTNWKESKLWLGDLIKHHFGQLKILFPLSCRFLKYILSKAVDSIFKRDTLPFMTYYKQRMLFFCSEISLHSYRYLRDQLNSQSMKMSWFKSTKI